MTSLFLNPSTTQNCQLDCPSLIINDTIERECLSVLHKLHDQVNGLQLVQVVVQPLAKLFNPASLAALAASNSHQTFSHHSPPSYKISNTTSGVTSINASSSHLSHQNSGGSQNSNASTSSSYNHPNIDHESASNPANNSTNTNTGSYNHSRSHSVASSFNMSGSANVSGSSSAAVTVAATGSTSTYMMSPDTAQALIARLDTDRDVNWLMEIIGYGLSMPFSLTGEQDSVKDCCTIYCEWLASSLMPYDENYDDSKYQQLSKLVPAPIRKDPNRYARKILSHLYNVFLPRQRTAPLASSGHYHHQSAVSSSNFNLSSSSKNSGNNATSGVYQKDESDAILTAVSRQAVLCHRVLRTIESVAHDDANLMDIETWQHLLALLLTVNDKLLSPPTEPDDIGTQLQDRILGVLFDLMLLASAKSVPDASLWKTFHVMCTNWRHRPALVDHWRRITSLLTKRIMTLPTTSPKSTLSQQRVRGSQANSVEVSVSLMSYENLSQSWYRFLNLIGNPVELSDPSIISRTDEFYHAACLANSVLDPRQHPCLNVLPQIFLNSILGVKDFVESFIESPCDKNLCQSQTHQPKSANTKIFDAASILPSALSQLNLNPDRPKCNSILHIFGDWLFSAALIGSELAQEVETDGGDVPGNDGDHLRDRMNSGENTMSIASSSTATATESGLPSFANSPMFARRQSYQSTTSSHTSISTGRSRKLSKQLEVGKITLEPTLSAESFEAGQAEAMATLCKIFASKSPNEDILPTYLARFYLCLQHCLNFGTGQDSEQSEHSPGLIKRQLLASVLTNSTALLQRDLDGVNLLIPSLIKAIEYVFECSEQDIPIQPPPRQHNGSRSGSIRTISTQTDKINYELKRACIMTLVNLLAYPLHFQDLAIRNCLDGTSPTTTFGSLRPRLLKLLFIALQTEKDVKNMQILFGGLSLAIHDLTSNLNGSSNDHNTSKQNKGRQTESGHNNMEFASGSKQANEDAISQSSFVFNSNDGFLIKSLHVTCHLLINIWKHDNLVSLAAIEVLTTIARVSCHLDSAAVNNASSFNENSISSKRQSAIEMKNEYMQTTKWICDYICNQCSRPPPAHSRDMHSTIVAAYQCLSVWLYNHPYLLRDNQCITTLMEVIELGVSGQKSKTTSMNPLGVTSSSIVSKSDKQLKPSSMRVREAAESLLNICMVRTCHHGPNNLALSDTVLNELDIAELFGGPQLKAGLRQHAMLKHDSETKRRLDVFKSFKYFSDEDSIIFALFEVSTSGQQQQQQQQHQTQIQDTSSKDSVICLLRTPFGKHCWKIKFNYYSEKSREKIIANKTLGLIKRPFQQQQQAPTPISDNRIFTFPKGHNKSLYFNQNARFFPASIENLAPTELDCLVTTLDEYVNNPSEFTEPRLKSDLDKMSKIFAHQVLAEQKVISECSVRIKRNDCEEPQQMNDLETARVIMTHLGLENALGPLLQDDKASDKFIEHLRGLDSQSVRTCDSVNIFYVRRQRTTLMEILESTRGRHNVSAEFFEWLLELGHPVVVKEHNRWTGKAYDSAGWEHVNKHQHSRSDQDDSGSALTRNQMLISDHGGAIFDGDRMSLYWSDMCQELAFLVPHRQERVSSNIIICWLESSDDLANVPCDTLLSLGKYGTTQQQQQYDERHHQTINVEHQQLSGPARGQPKVSKDYTKYFISPMKNGLFKVNLMTSCGRQWLALPLVDGMTVSKGMLASLLRESILNLCRRRRLDADSYQPPHVKRRLKIQEICNNYRISSRNESSEFYFNLFRNKTSN